MAVVIIITLNVFMRRRSVVSVFVMVSVVMLIKYKMCNSMVFFLKICLVG